MIFFPRTSLPFINSSKINIRFLFIFTIYKAVWLGWVASHSVHQVEITLMRMKSLNKSALYKISFQHMLAAVVIFTVLLHSSPLSSESSTVSGIHKMVRTGCMISWLTAWVSGWLSSAVGSLVSWAAAPISSFSHCQEMRRSCSHDFIYSILHLAKSQCQLPSTA